MQKISVFSVLFICFLLAQTGCKSGGDKEIQDDDTSKYTGSKFRDNIRSTPARSPEEERLGFKLPDGFEATLYASEPDIGKPINIAFDAKGRLWVTQSFEYPFAATPGNGKDRLTILDDTDKDGKADKFLHFNDTLNIPIGVIPVNDGAVAYQYSQCVQVYRCQWRWKNGWTKKIAGTF